MINNVHQLCIDSTSFRNDFEAIIQKSHDTDILEIYNINNECLIKSFKYEDLPFLFDELTSIDFKRKYLGLLHLEDLLEEPENDGLLINKLIDVHFIPKLIDFLESDEFPELQLESAWVLRNIIFKATNEQIICLIDFMRILQALIKLSNSNSDSYDTVKHFVSFYF